eukprot:363783-Chlamydomonas_euryale.AAC.12
MESDAYKRGRLHRQTKLRGRADSPLRPGASVGTNEQQPRHTGPEHGSVAARQQGQGAFTPVLRQSNAMVGTATTAIHRKVFGCKGAQGHWAKKRPCQHVQGRNLSILC